MGRLYEAPLSAVACLTLTAVVVSVIATAVCIAQQPVLRTVPASAQLVVAAASACRHAYTILAQVCQAVAIAHVLALMWPRLHLLRTATKRLAQCAHRMFVHCLDPAIHAVNRRAVVRLVCIPLGMYYLASGVMLRLNMSWYKPKISVDEWLVALGVFFMLGRESCKIQVLPFMAQLQATLHHSQALLTDLLPAHVVHQLVRSASDSSRVSGAGSTCGAPAWASGTNGGCLSTRSSLATGAGPVGAGRASFSGCSPATAAAGAGPSVMSTAAAALRSAFSCSPAPVAPPSLSAGALAIGLADGAAVPNLQRSSHVESTLALGSDLLSSGDHQMAVYGPRQRLSSPGCIGGAGFRTGGAAGCQGVLLSSLTSPGRGIAPASGACDEGFCSDPTAVATFGSAPAPAAPTADGGLYRAGSAVHGQAVREAAQGLMVPVGRVSGPGGGALALPSHRPSFVSMSSAFSSTDPGCDPSDCAPGAGLFWGDILSTMQLANPVIPPTQPAASALATPMPATAPSAAPSSSAVPGAGVGTGPGFASSGGTSTPCLPTAGSGGLGSTGGTGKDASGPQGRTSPIGRVLSSARTNLQRLLGTSSISGASDMCDLPRAVDLEVAETAGQKKVAEMHDCCTLFFSDIVNFSSWAHKLPPSQVMDTLNDLYTRLDDVILCELPSLYKVETIGDSYMVASNVLSDSPDQAATMVRFALRAQQAAAQVLRPDCTDGSTLQLRIGLNSGPVMSGIVGKLRRRFCMFGDTVNLASRTETSCPPGAVQLTAATYALAAPYLSPDEVQFFDRGLVNVKGADKPLHMYLAFHPHSPALAWALFQAPEACDTGGRPSLDNLPELAAAGPPSMDMVADVTAILARRGPSQEDLSEASTAFTADPPSLHDLPEAGSLGLGCCASVDDLPELALDACSTGGCPSFGSLLGKAIQMPDLPRGANAFEFEPSDQQGGSRERNGRRGNGRVPDVALPCHHPALGDLLDLQPAGTAGTGCKASSLVQELLCEQPGAVGGTGRPAVEGASLAAVLPPGCRPYLGGLADPVVQSAGQAQGRLASGGSGKEHSCGLAAQRQVSDDLFLDAALSGCRSSLDVALSGCRSSLDEDPDLEGLSIKQAGDVNADEGERPRLIQAARRLRCLSIHTACSPTLDLDSPVDK